MSFPLRVARCILLTSYLSLARAQLYNHVDPFIGTEGTVPGTGYNGGNTFPGAVVPFGMVKLGPDLTSANTSINANAGYLPDGNVTGLSLTHVSGTGGGRSMVSLLRCHC